MSAFAPDTKRLKHAKAADEEDDQAEDRSEEENLKVELARARAEIAALKTGEKKPKAHTGETILTLGKDRFITVKLFQKKPLVDLREFYEKDGELLPGKKGLSLSKDQWSKLKSLMGEIDAALEALE